MSDEQLDPTEAGFLSHLIELRDRLLRIVLIVALVFAALFPFANEIYTYLSGPLIARLPEGSSMIAIDVASPFLTPFKMVLMLSVIIAVPVILYQLWAFVAPGLYKHEKRLAKPLLISSVVLFYVGMAFAYYVVFPLVFGFFTSVAPDGVAVMTDINRYLDFIVMLFFAFGIAFEVPVATILMVAIGVTTPEKLGRMRPYVVVAAFVVGMLLTPPDVISQVLLAVPMWLLFEVGIVVSRILVTNHRKEENSIGSGVTAMSEVVAGEDAPASEATGKKPFEDMFVSIEPEEPATTPDVEDEEYRPLTEEEMDAELDRLDDEDGSLESSGDKEAGQGASPSDDGSDSSKDKKDDR
ncbi:MAG: twin-arginine translocase subunit TatC [bacterium]